MSYPQYSLVGYPPYRQQGFEPEDNTMIYVVIIVGVLVAFYMWNRSRAVSAVTDDPVPDPDPGPSVDPNAPTCADPAAYYYYYSPDVKAAGADAQAHWNFTGYKEGRKSCWPFPTASGTAGGPRTHTDRLTSDGIGGYNNLLINEAVFSTDRKYYLTLDASGNAMVIDAATGDIKWQTKSGGKGGMQMVLQGDANLVIVSADNKPIWAWGSNQSTSNMPVYLVMQGDSNLVLRRKSDGKSLKDTM